jgi:undecaprenyl-diphosphatase
MWHAACDRSGVLTAPDLIDELLASDLVDDPRRSAAREPVRAKVTARRRRRWGREAALAATTLTAIGGFLALTRTISGKHGNAFDRTVVRATGRARHPIGNVIFRGLTFFGSAAGATAVSTAALWLTRRTPLLALQVVVGALGGISAEVGFKRLFRRDRPTLLGHLEEQQSTSFPSGHAMASASLYLSLAFVASRSRRLRARRGTLLSGAAGLAASVGVSRVYLGVHWPTDVLAGFALGTAWACLTEAAFDLSGADRVERQARRRSRDSRDAPSAA